MTIQEIIFLIVVPLILILFFIIFEIKSDKQYKADLEANRDKIDKFLKEIDNRMLNKMNALEEKVNSWMEENKYDRDKY